MINVLRFYDDNCKQYEDGDPSQFSVPACIAVLVVWVVIYLAIFNGVGSSSYIVWATVPLPVIFIIIMLIKGVSLEGAKDGIDFYLNGDPSVEYDPNVWADAVG